MARTNDKGYGYQHRKLRKQWAAIVDKGDAHCWRCGAWLDPDQPWHLGHDDHDRSKYRGPECVPCNTATYGRNQAPSRWVL